MEQEHPPTVKLQKQTILLICILVFVCLLQIFAIILGILFPVDIASNLEGSGDEGSVGYFKVPWLANWSCFSCFALPSVPLLLAASACTLASRAQSKRDIFWKWFVLWASVLIMCYSFFLAFIAQLTFVPPAGSS